MLPTESKNGWLFRYAYLWHWQHLEGREEGDKDRLALVLAIVATLDDGTPAVRVLPVTHSPRPIRKMLLKSRPPPSAASGSMTNASGLF